MLQLASAAENRTGRGAGREKRGEREGGRQQLI
jgi:hypothetical protein